MEADTIEKAQMKEKNNKRLSQMTEKASWNHPL